jgi:hypothetical protein
MEMNIRMTDYQLVNEGTGTPDPTYTVPILQTERKEVLIYHRKGTFTTHIPLPYTRTFITQRWPSGILLLKTLCIAVNLLILSNPLMKYIRRRWFKIAMKDPAFLLVALAHSATSLALLEESQDPKESLTFRTEAIRIINERIGDAIKDCQLGESTIGAVSSLASYEVSVPRSDAALEWPHRVRWS